MDGVFGAQNSIFDSSIWHYGNPFGEQRQASEAGAYCIDHTLGFLSITGADRITFLNTLSTQLLLSLSPGQAQQTLLLDTHGRIEHHLWIYATEQEIILSTARATIDDVHQYLQKMIFWSDVKIELRQDLIAIHLLGPAHLYPLSSKVADYPSAFRIPCHTYIVSEQDIPDLTADLTEKNFYSVGMWTYEAFRIASLIPRFPLDADEKAMPQELDLINTGEQDRAVHLHKGCYRGQETVAKIYNLGKAPRRLILLSFDEAPDEEPMVDTPIYLKENIVGRLGSVIHHYELGTIGLGLIKRSIPVDAHLTIGQHHVSIDPEFYQVESVTPPGKLAILEFQGKK